MPFYAVRVGRTPGIYHSWDGCKAQVSGFPSAKFKRFDTKQEAENFLQGERNDDSLPPRERQKNNNSNQQSQPSAPCSEHNSVSRDQFPSSPVVYVGSCRIDDGEGRIIAGVGVFWAPGHPYNLRESVLDKPTLQKTELIASMKALQVATLMELSSIELRTTSEHTVNSVAEFLQQWQNRGWKGTDSGINDELLMIGEYTKSISVTWAYVPQNQLCYGIEEAENLAKEGASQAF